MRKTFTLAALAIPKITAPAFAQVGDMELQDMPEWQAAVDKANANRMAQINAPVARTATGMAVPSATHATPPAAVSAGSAASARDAHPTARGIKEDR